MPGLTRLAIFHSVSLRRTSYVSPGAIGERAIGAGGGAAATLAGDAGVSAAVAATGAAARTLVAPPELTLGAATVSVAAGPGAKTGGSSSTVYSRSSRPRGQFASTSSVTNGSVTGRGEVTRSTSRPSGPRVTWKLNSER